MTILQIRLLHLVSELLATIFKFRYGYLEGEDWALLGLGAHLNNPFQLLEDHLWNSQAESQASSVHIFWFRYAPEELEKFLQVLLWDSDASVENIRYQTLILKINFDSDWTLEGKFRSIPQKVEEYLLETLLIREDPMRNTFINVNF